METQVFKIRKFTKFPYPRSYPLLINYVLDSSTEGCLRAETSKFSRSNGLKMWVSASGSQRPTRLYREIFAEFYENLFTHYIYST